MRQLPRHYYVIVFLWLLMWGCLGAIAAVDLFGADPYTGFIVGWCIPMLVEVASLKRKGY